MNLVLLDFLRRYSGEEKKEKNFSSFFLFLSLYTFCKDEISRFRRGYHGGNNSRRHDVSWLQFLLHATRIVLRIKFALIKEELYDLVQFNGNSIDY